ncbi:MAG: DUF2442 domain-containing protein [Alphaproteobacteria bacterium]|nr:DUF2442 domain-containing protein [Alphaproteobacteria bacterium]
MLPKLINVIPLNNHEIQLTYNNKEIRIFSLKPFLHLPIYNKLHDINLFKKITIQFNTIQWDDTIDIDPESLYNLSKFSNFTN